MHKIARYFIFIHRENALKAHQHISYHCSIQREHFKKTILIQNLIKIFAKMYFSKYSPRHIKLHIFSKFSCVV